MGHSLTHPHRGPLRVGQHITAPGIAGRILALVGTPQPDGHQWAHITWHGKPNSAHMVRLDPHRRIGTTAVIGDVVGRQNARGPWIVTGTRLMLSTSGGGYYRELQITGTAGAMWIPDDSDVIPMPLCDVHDARRWHDAHR